MEKRNIIQCEHGRWLAVSPPDSIYKVGVLADSPEAAGEDLDRAIARWHQLRTLNSNNHTSDLT